jgi:Transposase IS4
MTPRKSQRLRKPATIWKEKGAPSAANDPKITKKTVRTVEKTALKPVATGPLSKAVGFDAAYLPKLSTYKPSLELKFQLSISLAIDLSELEVFQQLLTPAIIDRIIDTTNSYAANTRANNPEILKLNSRTRLWKPVNSTEIWRYIGCLLYKGSHIERKHEEH